MEWINLKEIEEIFINGSKAELIIECKVEEFIHRVSKKGNYFAVLGVRDDFAFQRFFLFGDDYKKFREYDIEGEQILLKGTCEDKRFSDGYELKIKEIVIVS